MFFAIVKLLLNVIRFALREKNSLRISEVRGPFKSIMLNLLQYLLTLKFKDASKASRVFTYKRSVLNEFVSYTIPNFYINIAGLGMYE